MTPVGSAVDIGEELGKEDPSYAKIGVIAAGDVLGAAIPAVGPVAKSLIKEGVQKLDEVKDLTKNAETNALEEVGLTEESLAAWKEKNYAKDKFRIPPKPELMKAAEDLRDGKLSQEEYRKLSSQLQPIVTIEEMPKFPSKEDVIQALHATDKRKVEKGIIGVNKEIPDGTPISARLDIPAYNDTDTWIVSLHDGTEKSGATVGYAQTAVLQDVKFTTNPLAASAIASGKPKTTIARMNGSYINADPDDVYNYTKEILENKTEGWTQVGMNPTRASYFYDKSDGMPVVSADEVVQVGPLVMAKNVKKTTPDDKMFEFTNKRTGVTANFSEGGMALEEQMAMNFGDVPDNTIGQDPVSGNDIPLGSTAENVRDDIPAMLSEGEIVIPADVVNYHGVKLFEDLRDEAKLGYAEMAEDGRIGGEPIEDDMEMENDIGLDLADLEVMEVPDEPVEMRRGGMNFERGRGNIYKSYSAPKPTPRVVRSAPPAYKTRSVGSLKDSSPRSYTPAQLGITKIQAPTTSGPERPTLTSKPATSDTANIGNSIAQQIGMYDKDFREKPVEQKSTAERLADIRKRNAAASSSGLRRGVNRARDFVGGLFDFGDEQEKEGPQRVQITGDADYGFLGSPLERANRKGLGPKQRKFDEGGMATDDNLIGGEDQFNQPFYAEDQKGGFDMDMAYPDQVGSGTGEPMLEMREYMNDQGHRIFITFIDGEPQMEIPAGYYPVGEATIMQPVGSTGVIPTVNYGSVNYGASQNDDPGVKDMVMPEGINYKELSLAELQEMVEDQKSFGSKIFGNLSPVTKIIMWDQTRRTKAELERRRDDPNTSEVDKRRYDTLLELANRDEPGLIATLLNKITGKETEAPGRTQEQTDALYNQLDKMTKAYTPDVQEASSMTTPGVDETNKTSEPFVPSPKDSIPPVSSGFGGMGIDPAEEFGGSQTRFDPSTVDSTPAPKTATAPITQASPRVQQARKGTQEVLQNMRDRGASREERTQALKAGARTENVLRDLDRGVVRGFEKGGLVEEPVVKEVVKGLKKASKTHAKQAGQLEKALKASKKKKKSK